MKHSLILKQHIPYAAMICKALDFCEIMLSHSNTVYPFAALTMENDIQCVFIPSDTQDATLSMIEALEMRVYEHQMYAESSVSVLVYNATISSNQRAASMTQSFRPQTDALVFNITDSAGKNNVTIYPYSIANHKIIIEKPYTCDFSD